MDPIIESHTDTFRIAVELNNIGVTLLEAEDYKGAMHTLSEAVEVMKLAASPWQNGDEQETLDMNLIYGILDNARRRMASIGQLPVSKAAIYSTESSFTDFIKPTQRLPNPILIVFETVPYINTNGNEEKELLSPDVESSIIFYNLAVVHIWASRRLKSKDNFLKGSLKLFKMCISLTITDFGALLDAPLEEIRDRGSSRLLLGLLALNNVMQLQKGLGDRVEARDCLKCLMRLGHVVRLEGIVELHLTVTTPAA